jgi:hypothetical protein
MSPKRKWTYWRLLVDLALMPWSPFLLLTELQNRGSRRSAHDSL